MYNTFFGIISHVFFIVPFIGLVILALILFLILKNKNIDNNVLPNENLFKYVLRLNRRSLYKALPFILITLISFVWFKYEVKNTPDFCYENWLCGIELVPLTVLSVIIFISLIIKFIITIIIYKRNKKL